MHELSTDFTMPTDYEHLPWDSEFFGFSVVRIRIGEAVLLGPLLDHLRRIGVQLAYWFVNTHDTEARDASLQHMGVLVDRKLTYCMAVPEGYDQAANPGHVRDYVHREPTAALFDLAVASGNHSRFRVDPSIEEEKFRDLYRTWMTNSTNRLIADSVLVSSSGSEDTINGVITLRSQDGVCIIGLLAVDSSVRGRGLGRQLVDAAVRWAAQRQCREIRVTTQADNGPACTLYAKIGFKVVNAEHVFHFWPQGAS